MKEMPIRMRLQQIDHVALICASPAASLQWYGRVLGFKQVFPGQWQGVPLFIRLGSTYLALFPHRSGRRRPPRTGIRMSHLAFRAKTQADFTRAQKALRRHRISFQFQNHEISHSIYFVDPDGHQLEITTYDLPAPAKRGRS